MSILAHIALTVDQICIFVNGPIRSLVLCLCHVHRSRRIKKNYNLAMFRKSTMFLFLGPCSRSHVIYFDIVFFACRMMPEGLVKYLHKLLTLTNLFSCNNSNA